MKKRVGLPPGYSESDIPGSKNKIEKKKVSKEISNMIHSISELPSGKLPKAQYPLK